MNDKRPKPNGTKRDAALVASNDRAKSLPVKIKPYRTVEGNFFQVGLRSINNPTVWSYVSFPLKGNETRLEYSVQVAIGALCEHQFNQFKDMHNISDTQADGVEAFRILLKSFSEMMKKNGPQELREGTMLLDKAIPMVRRRRF